MSICQPILGDVAAEPWFDLAPGKRRPANFGEHWFAFFLRKEVDCLSPFSHPFTSSRKRLLEIPRKHRCIGTSIWWLMSIPGIDHVAGSSGIGSSQFSFHLFSAAAQILLLSCGEMP